jgi:hypothetical protein
MAKQVYRNYWQPSSQEKKTKPINGKPKAKVLETKLLTKTNNKLTSLGW